MIKINDKKIEIGNFPDGTMLMKHTPPKEERIDVKWHYENDREMIALIYLAQHMQAHGCDNIHLYMPYIPNARQDRVKTDEDVFTLKYFLRVYLSGIKYIHYLIQTSSPSISITLFISHN